MTISTDNAAFDADRGEELVRILRETAQRINDNPVKSSATFSFAVWDANGNKVGRAELAFAAALEAAVEEEREEYR